VTGALYYVIPDKIDAFTAAPIAIGGSVVAAWCVLYLTRRWDASSGWIDRTGRLLGVAAIAAMFFCLVLYRI
jgi:hypothetical protein